MKKVAFASSDGEFVDRHFGQADTFFVYALDTGSQQLLEKREAPAIAGHSQAEFQRIYELFADCDAVVANKIGYPAAAYLIGKGVRVFESEFAVADILNKLKEENLLSD